MFLNICARTQCNFSVFFTKWGLLLNVSHLSFAAFLSIVGTDSGLWGYRVRFPICIVFVSGIALLARWQRSESHRHGRSESHRFCGCGCAVWGDALEGALKRAWNAKKCKITCRYLDFFVPLQLFLAKPLSDRERAQGFEAHGFNVLKRRMLRCNSLIIKITQNKWQ